MMVKCISTVSFYNAYFTIGKSYLITEYKNQIIGIVTDNGIPYIMHVGMARQMFDLSRLDKLTAFI